MLYLALARLPFSFRTVNLKTGVQNTPEYLAINRWGVVPSLRHRGLTILQSNVILDYLARATGHFEGATEQAALAGARMAVVGGRPHHRGGAGAARGAVPPGASRGDRRVPAARRGGAVIYRRRIARPRLAGRRSSARSPISAAGAAWCSWPRAVSKSRNWPHLEAWSRRLKAMPGFAPPYDLIPEQGPRIRPPIEAARSSTEARA